MFDLGQCKTCQRVFLRTACDDPFFYNGNKRTALVAFTLLLDIHELTVTLPEMEMEDYTVALTVEGRYKNNHCIQAMVDELKPYVVAKEERADE